METFLETEILKILPNCTEVWFCTRGLLTKVIDLRFVEDGWLGIFLIIGMSTPFLMSNDPSLSFERFSVVLISLELSRRKKRWIHDWLAAWVQRTIIKILIKMMSILINGSLIKVFLAHQHFIAFFLYFPKLWCGFHALFTDQSVLQLHSKSNTFPAIGKYFDMIRMCVPVALGLWSIITCNFFARV